MVRERLGRFPLSLKLLSLALAAAGTLGLGIQFFMMRAAWRHFRPRSYFLSRQLACQEADYFRLLDRAAADCLRFVREKMLAYDYHSPFYQSLKGDKDKLQRFRRQLKALAARISAGSDFRYKMRFLLFPCFIYQSVFLMLIAAGFLIISGRVKWGLHFAYFSLIFCFLSGWIVCFFNAGFVLGDPHIVWLNSFNHLIHRISPSFSPVSPFSFWRLTRDFIRSQRMFWVNSLGGLGAIFLFVLFYKFKWKYYCSR